MDSETKSLLEYQAGEVAALRAIVVGILSTLPTVAHEQAAVMLEFQLSAKLAGPATEALLQGMRDTQTVFRGTPRKPAFRRAHTDAEPFDPR